MSHGDLRVPASATRFPRARLGTLLLSMAMAGPWACSKKASSEQGETAPSPLPKAEAERGLKACESYVARLCACAESHPELAEDCTLAKARPQAFALNLELSATPGLAPAEQTAVKVEARKIAAACFEDESKLDPQLCPRLAP